MIKTTKHLALTALALGVLGVSGAAQAASVPAERLPVIESGALIKAQYDRRDRDYRRPPPPPPRYVPGRRYDAPPPRWHRHYSRPPDWRRRGCIIVGPIWFCP